jgi:hypothetical protein
MVGYWHDLTYENKKQVDLQENTDSTNTTSEKRTLALSLYNSKKCNYLILDPQYTEGVNGIEQTDIMFIMEPLQNFARLRQLRARVVRKGSHKKPEDISSRYGGARLVSDINASNNEYLQARRVHIYEYHMSLKFIQHYMLNTTAFKQWLHHDKHVFYFIRKVFFSQSTTPDESVLQAQAQSAEFDRKLASYIGSRETFKPKCKPWTLPHGNNSTCYQVSHTDGKNENENTNSCSSS